jgi:transcriptional regulator with XRE-family HTH domain
VRQRLAHFLCELVWRHKAIGLSEDHAIRLPLTQTDLADTLGLTSMHVNRILQGFRREELIMLARRRVILRDVERLKRVALFNEDYLHFDGAPEEVERYLDRLEQDHAGPDRP